jgi:hypothetical protein
VLILLAASFSDLPVAAGEVDHALVLVVHQRCSATTAQTASTNPKGHAP